MIGVSLLESVLCQSNVLFLRFCACNNGLVNNGPLLAFTVHGTLGFHPAVTYTVTGSYREQAGVWIRERTNTQAETIDG